MTANVVDKNLESNLPELTSDKPIETGQLLRMAAAAAKKPYFPYLEGLRGLAALMVTVYHLWRQTLDSDALTGSSAVIRDWVGAIFHGRLPVDVFIVLSGYLLMRPAARSADGRLPGGTLSYLRRRAWRILPPYYAALTLTLGFLLIVPALNLPLSEEWSDSLPAFSRRAIVSHCLMIHNFSWRWSSKIDAPMWTVATEWDIYFIFPFLLLPVWRRRGSFAAIAVGLGLGLGGYLYTHKGNSAAPWFIGLFAFGMAAAARDRAGRLIAHDRKLFGWLAAVLFAVYAAFIVAVELRVFDRFGVHDMEDMWQIYWPMDLLVGAATACLLVFASAAAAEKGSRIISALSARWIVWLGLVSYSLYLIHDPLFALMKLPLAWLNVGPFGQFFVMLGIGLPLVIGITYGFHMIFEKPFMSARRVREADLIVEGGRVR